MGSRRSRVGAAHSVSVRGHTGRSYTPTVRADAAEVVIRLAGHVTLTFGGREVDPQVVGGPRCAQVLAFVALNRHRDIPLDELADVLWRSQRPPTWKSALRVSLSRVRETVRHVGLPAECLRSRNSSVRLTLPKSMCTDLELARRYVDDALNDPKHALANAERALDLLSAPFLDDISGSWADAVRSDATMLRIRALELDAEWSLRAALAARAAESAQILIGLDPLRENAYRLAMRGQIAMGERGHALATAARCRRALAEELGTAPSEETEELYREILRDHATPAAVDEFAEQSVVPRHGLIERAAELAVIGDAVKRASVGSGQFVAVVGEAGTGKTYLILDAMDRAAEFGATVLFGRCSEEAVVSFEPFVEAIGREIDDLGPTRARERLRAVGPALRRLIPGAARVLGESETTSATDDDRAEIMSGVSEWLTAPDRTSPVVMVIDDLHWASPATADVLRYVIHSSESARVTVLTTLREEFVDRPDLRSILVSSSRSRGVHRIELGAFDLAQVKELVEASGSAHDPTLLHERTGGLPFFVSSLLSAHQQDTEELPASVAESVANRIRLLGQPANELLALCAVVGLLVPRAVLRAAASSLDDEVFASSLDELSRSRLIIQYDARNEIAIRHALVRDAVYSGIADGRRAHIHSRIARAFQEFGLGHEPDGYARLAYHSSRGLDADRSRAVDYSIRAGDAAAAIGAYEDAVVLYHAAAERLTPRGDSARRCRLLIDLGRAQRQARDPEFRPTLLEAAHMARRLGDTDLQVAATLANNMHGILFVQIFADHERIDSLYDALHALESTGRVDDSAVAHVLAQLAVELIWTADHHVRRALLMRGIDVARAAGDAAAEREVHCAVLVALRTPHMADLRYTSYLELLQLLGSSPGRAQEPLTAVWVARAQIEFGQLAFARRTIGMVSPAQTSRDPELAWLVSSVQFGVALAAGRLERCERELEALTAIPVYPLETYSFGRMLAFICGLRALRGDMRTIVDAADELTARFDIVDSYRPILALAYADVGDVDAATELLAWYDRPRVEAIAVDHVWPSAMGVLARAAAFIGNTVVCEAVYDLLRPHADTTLSAVSIVYGVTHHHLAHLSIALGEYERARLHLDDALTAHRARGYDGWYAETLYLAALLETRTSAEASEELARRARRAAADTGATAVARRLDMLVSNQEV